jgi:hypothetical protein
MLFLSQDASVLRPVSWLCALPQLACSLSIQYVPARIGLLTRVPDAG